MPSKAWTYRFGPGGGGTEELVHRDDDEHLGISKAF